MSSPALKLMIPGPVEVADNVLEAMGSPVRPHYGAAWTEFYNQTLALLAQVFGTAGDVFLMPGSGTCGIDAAIGSLLSSGEAILIGNNGYFGDRLEAVAASYGLDVVSVKAAWGEPLDPETVHSVLQAHPEIRVVAVVHLETSTGVANPIDELGAVCRSMDRVLVVDAVSSLGGLPMRMDEWGIDLCVSATQKCLGAPPGLAPVAVGARSWPVIDRNPAKGHGFYGDLRVWRQYSRDWADWHPFPVTMATNNVVALRASLEALLREGIQTRLDRYCQLALRLRAGLREIGMPPFTPDERLAPVLTTAYGPPGVPTGQIVDYMAEQRSIKIAGGLGALKDRVIRIGHMSPTVSEADIDAVIEGLASFKFG